MIIGNGMMAKAFLDFEDDKNILIYAKGVSNSQEKEEVNFQRESILLESALTLNAEKTIIYFSTCSIDDVESEITPYVAHKLKMEKLIQESGLEYFIFRLPQVVGITKSPTLIHFLSDKVKNGEEFDVWLHSSRNLIDVDDVYKITSYLIKNKLLINNIVNVASELTINIKDIIHKIEDKLMKKGIYKEIDIGTTYNIDISKVKAYLKPAGVIFDDSYVDNVINKYV